MLLIIVVIILILKPGVLADFYPHGFIDASITATLSIIVQWTNDQQEGAYL